MTDFVSSWKKFHLDLYNEYKPTIESRVDLFSAIAPKVYAGNFELDMIEVRLLNFDTVSNFNSFHARTSLVSWNVGRNFISKCGSYVRCDWMVVSSFGSKWRLSKISKKRSFRFISRWNTGKKEEILNFVFFS